MTARFLFLLLLIFPASESLAVQVDKSFGSEIIDAADRGNDFETTRLLRNKVSPNTKGVFDTTPLIRASLNGHVSTVRFLLESGANPNLKDVGGATALHLAARSGHVEVVKLLMKYGASADLPDNEGYSALKRAIKAQQVSVVSEMLSKSAELDDKGKIGISARQLGLASKNPQLKEMFEQQKTLEVSKLGEELLMKHSLAIPSEKAPPKEEVKELQVVVKEEEPKKLIAPILLTDKNVKVNVAEAVRVPMDVDLAAKKPLDATLVEKPETPTSEPLVMRTKSMEISGFIDEDEALSFWQEYSDRNFAKGKLANIVHDNTTSHTRYYLRFKNFNSSTDVFNSCKEVRKIRKTLLCYSLHDIY